jgi:integrase
MSSITKVGTGDSARYRARWRTPDGQSRSRTFALKGDAQRHLTSVEGSKLVGAYIDPRAGRVTFGEFAKAWQASQVYRPATASAVDVSVRVHMLPTFEKRALSSIRPSEVQAWVRGLGDELAPGTVRLVVQHARAIFRAAVRDRLISSSPVDGVRLPSSEQRAVVPLEREAVLAIIDALPERFRGVAIVCAGAGLRPAEAVGLTLDEVDFLRRQLSVRHQLASTPGGPAHLAPPKTPGSSRTIPLPDYVRFALARHLELVEPGPDGLLFTTEDGEPLIRQRFGEIWRAAVKAAGLPVTVRWHDLRHFYASALIHAGESVKTVQSRLGHKSAVTTLDTYGHLWPDSEDQTRRAIDDVLGQPDSFGPNVSVKESRTLGK